jgi:thiol-disulfide isomerase/thioredoxin
MSAPSPAATPLTPWRARLLRRASAVDLGYCAAVLLLAVSALGAGNVAARHLSPDGARSVAKVLDDLELPRALPNAVLARADGTEERLWDVAGGPRTIVSFYAPWCAPCQEELPTLVQGTAKAPHSLVVIVGPDEDPAEVRTKLDNLGLKDQRYYVDTRRELETGGRVSALPTTFLIGRMGRVHERIVGYSQFRLSMLISRAAGGDTPFSTDDDS